jgi:hypothetical protein
MSVALTAPEPVVLLERLIFDELGAAWSEALSLELDAAIAAEEAGR